MLKLLWLVSGFCLFSTFTKPPHKNYLTELSSPVLFRGDNRTAYRDPAILYHNDSLYVFFFFTSVRVEADNRVYSYTAMSQTKDLQHGSSIRILPPATKGWTIAAPAT